MLTPMLTSQRPNQLILNLRWVGSVTQARRKHSMSEEQPTFKVVDRRPFNPDGSPRELSPEERAENERAAASTAAAISAEPQMAPPPAAPPTESPAPSEAQPVRPKPQPERTHAGGDP